jgi:D-alanyl-D-alanine carboxypeptidase (penicillin-binding protein 5/6)
VPIASVTKIMTAIIVLRDHPLGHGSGPSFTMTAANHAAYIHDATNDDSNLLVVAGERLTERQLLEALMIPSADNIADYLARWDAGSIPAFVKKMNAMAKALGLSDTHYADASGLNPESRSTAVDQAILGSFAMRVPGLISVEDHPSMTFPVEGTVGNFNPVVGVDGVIGVKSGFTSASQGCLVTAAWRKVGGHSVLIISSTLGQPLNLPQVGQIDLQLLDAAASDLEARPILRAGQPVAAVVAGWTPQRPHIVVKGDPATVVGWGGLPVRTVVTPSIPYTRGAPNGWQAGDTMATVQVSTPGGVQTMAFATLDRFLPPAPAGWVPPSSTGSTVASAGN